MADPRCPACDAERMAEGTCSSCEYNDGLWVGCTACGFSVSGPDPTQVHTAMRIVQRSTAMKELRNG